MTRQLAPKKRKKKKKKGGRFPAAGSSTAPQLGEVPDLVVERRSIDVGSGWSKKTITLQREYVDCGRCPRAHGPYWYAYRREPAPTSHIGGGPWPKGRLHKVYVGKRLDEKKAERLLRERGAL